jgi:hypothetical protein
MKRSTFNPKAVETKVPRGPGTRGVLPFYRELGNSKRKAAQTLDVCDRIDERHRGRVYLDFDKDGELIGVEIVG